MPNRLADETSPYLLQHAGNPVDWWPWCEAAFAEARRRDVPIFLSVGYSTCYWCHVMEREVFENKTLASQMNDGFVCVKVDREERPEVDEHYMTATQVLAGQGGWPMSVFLTPDGVPFYAGTYFPPKDMAGRPGFGTLMSGITDAWQNRRDQVAETTRQIEGILQELAKPKPPTLPVTLDRDRLTELTSAATMGYDAHRGGFGGSPKFPQQTTLELLLVSHAHDYGVGAETILNTTLDAMAQGGIRDHLGGAFHRYSVDAKWLVPHFEIMLYDQGLLAWVYATAAKQFDAPRHGEVARRICQAVIRDLQDDGGAFYSALDAEVDGVEGDPYTWTPAQIVEVLGVDDGAAFNAVYGLGGGFNFADPHGPNPQSPDRNVLFLAEPTSEHSPEMMAMRDKLLEARGRRKQPRRDDKIITSWNGLMIRGMARAGVVLSEPVFVGEAQRAADWILDHCRNDRGGLRRIAGSTIDAGLDDYVHFAAGLVELHSATGDERWHHEAVNLMTYAREHFASDGGALWSDDASTAALPIMKASRRMVAGDNPLPGGNATAAGVLLSLGDVEAAVDILKTFAGQLVKHPGGLGTMLASAIKIVDKVGPVDIDAGPDTEDESSALQVVGGQWLEPDKLEIALRVADGFHVYATDSANGQAVKITSNHAGLRKVELPPSSNNELAGEFAVGLGFAEPASGQEIEITVAYQACDDTRCLAPASITFTVRPDAIATT